VRNIFLLDGLGALLTASLTGLLLPAIQRYIGIPIPTLWCLALIASAFSLYSLACHFFLQTKRPVFLKVIMTANLLYCILIASLLIHHLATLKPLGIAYIIGEIMVILLVLYVESRVLRSVSKRQENV
jgi:hypothetical protein